jgi:predicted Fe-Mo cluster-binding NifX family protein
LIICITASGREESSQQDPRFGRCEAFYLFDDTKKEGRFIDNPFKNAVGGAGVRAAELIVKEGASRLVSGQIGPNAWDVLKEAGIRVFSSKEANIRAALEAFLAGNLSEVEAPGPAGHK